MNILKAQNIEKQYKNGSNYESVLKDLSIEIPENKIIAIVGPSGCGKSSLLYILAGLDKPEKGSVFINGIDLYKLDDKKLAKFRNQNIGFIYQFHHLLNDFNILDNVILPRIIAHKNKKDAKKDATELLKELGIENLVHKYPNEISGGERQRVAIARALINNPKIIFADEPTGNLDPKSSNNFMELIFKIQKKMNTTFLIVTHDEKIASLADHTITLTK
ncbi:MAG: ABC transporter ATP-binding protein [Psittacicella sp.]